jgi:regulator of sigma E protease
MAKVALMAFIQGLLFFKNIIFIAAGLLGISFIIAFHELGHFLFCKIFNIKTPSFSIGMGPRLIARKIGETEFIIAAIPLGGYVEIAQAPEHHISEHEKKRYFSFKPYWQKMLVMSGGILFNFILSYSIFFLLYSLGMPNSPLLYPENARPVISSIMTDSPAQKADLQINDRLIELNGQALHDDVSYLFKLLYPLSNQLARVTIERGNERKEIELTVGEKKVGNQSFGFLGIGFQTEELPPFSLVTALKKSITKTHALAYQTIISFKHMLTRKSLEGLGGPIIIISQTIAHAERGIKILLTFLALISINLAILNLLPLPILDGGQALLATIEAIIRRPLALRIKEIIHLITWTLMLLLFFYISFRDIMVLRFLKTQANAEQKNNTK